MVSRNQSCKLAMLLWYIPRYMFLDLKDSPFTIAQNSASPTLRAVKL